MNKEPITVKFERHRTVLWVCDIEGSSSALNNPQSVDAAEEFLKRFFWLSSVLVRHTGGLVAKWTGDGFLAAYDVPLERDLGATAKIALEAAWELSFLVNVTQLGVSAPRKFRLRHGLAYEPDAIVVSHAAGDTAYRDVIGRGVVLAFRLSGIRAPFPGVVAHRRLIAAARDVGLRHAYRSRAFTREEVLKYFKGERWSTSEIAISSERRPRASSKDALVRKTRALVMRIEKPGAEPKQDTWVGGFLEAMAAGPTWSRMVVREWTDFIKKDMLGAVKDMLGILEKKTSKAAQPGVD
jgi:class 3 adenylate cyclase